MKTFKNFKNLLYQHFNCNDTVAKDKGFYITD